MAKVKVTIGTIWEDRGNGKQFEVTGINKDTGVIQISAVGNGDGYKTMTESSLRKNYKLTALKVKELKAAVTPVTTTEPTKEPEKSTDASPERTEGKSGRAAGGRVQLSDGKVIAGSKFITEVCGQSRDVTYKADSPIRWLLKPAGQELLKAHSAAIVYGEKITKE